MSICFQPPRRPSGRTVGRFTVSPSGSMFSISSTASSDSDELRVNLDKKEWSDQAWMSVRSNLLAPVSEGLDKPEILSQLLRNIELDPEKALSDLTQQQAASLLSPEYIPYIRSRLSSASKAELKTISFLHDLVSTQAKQIAQALQEQELKQIEKVRQLCDVAQAGGNLTAKAHSMIKQLDENFFSYLNYEIDKELEQSKVEDAGPSRWLMVLQVIKNGTSKVVESHYDSDLQSLYRILASTNVKAQRILLQGQLEQMAPTQRESFALTLERICSNLESSTDDESRNLLASVARIRATMDPVVNRTLPPATNKYMQISAAC